MNSHKTVPAEAGVIRKGKKQEKEEEAGMELRAIPTLQGESWSLGEGPQSLSPGMAVPFFHVSCLDKLRTSVCH